MCLRFEKRNLSDGSHKLTKLSPEIYGQFKQDPSNVGAQIPSNYLSAMDTVSSLREAFDEYYY